jgi:hypothetical protein
MTMHTEIRLIAGLAFLFILYSVWMGQLIAQGLPDGYSNPVLALELVKDGKDITRIINAENGKVRDFIRKNTHKDFGFIFVYALFFISLSVLLSRMNFSWAMWVGWLGAACAVLAAILDLVEDRGMLKAIAGEASDSLAKSIRYPSLAKWGLLFIFSLLVGLLLIGSRNILAVSAAFFLVAAVLGLVGVLLNLLRPRFYWTFPAATFSIGTAIAVLAIAFILWPGRLFNKFTR